MVEIVSKKPQYSEYTALREAGMDPSIAKQIWQKVAQAEQQLQLLNNLNKLKIGVNEVESYTAKQGNHKKSKKFKDKRDEDTVMESMVKKLVDADQYLREVKFDQTKIRREIEEILVKNSRKARNVFKQLRIEAQSLKRNIKVKSEEKIQHLKMKNKKKEEIKLCEVPEKIKSYKDL